MTFLASCGCNELQGFLFSEPLPPDEFAALLRENVAYTGREKNMENSTREQVRVAATKLFVEKGLAEVSLHEIAEATGVDDAWQPKLFGQSGKDL